MSLSAGSFLEIVIPARNPGIIFLETVKSLVEQTSRDFSVLISDNFSTTGLDIFDQAERDLTKAGLSVRRIHPPHELERVEHWNWSHHQVQATWLKPLFVGDRLAPAFVRRISEVKKDDPSLRFIVCYCHDHADVGTSLCSCGNLAGKIEAQTTLQKALFYGNFIGGPINVCMEKSAFQSSGGYNSTFPIMADFDLYTRLALHVPTYIIPEPLAHFVRHGNRFSSGFSAYSMENNDEELFILMESFFYLSRLKKWPVPELALRVYLAKLRWRATRARLIRWLARGKHALLGSSREKIKGN